LYTHTPSFKPDEKVVVFAQKDGQGSLRVTGGLQGKYSVKESEATGKPMVAGDKPLAEFLSRVRVAIESGTER
jgi:hypothetical protein